MTIPHHLSRLLWIPALSLILGIPVISWVFHTSFATTSPLTLLGQLTGIVGAQLFATALVLSIRHKYLEYLFGGLDRMYTIHHRLGVIAFSFLAVHPLVLAFRYATISVNDMMWFLLPIDNTTAKDFGIYALLLMLILLFITFYGAIFSYRSLKNMHRFMGFAFFLATLHMFLIPSTIQSDVVLRYSCLGMATLGLLAFTYRTLLGRFLVSRYRYVVSSVQTLGQNITEIVLSPEEKVLRHIPAPEEKVLRYIPGQFAMLSLINANVVGEEEHPFTISSARENGDIRFSIRGLGDFTTSLANLSVGTQARIEGPFGEFSYKYGSQSQVWVAGGIGVTPFASMAEYLLTQEVIEYTIDFYYSVRTKADAVYEDLFNAVAKKHSSFVFHLIPSDTSGFVTVDGIMKDISDAQIRSYFVCGPPPMMDTLIANLRNQGVKSKLIHSERFSLLR